MLVGCSLGLHHLIGLAVEVCAAVTIMNGVLFALNPRLMNIDIGKQLLRIPKYN